MAQPVVSAWGAVQEAWSVVQVAWWAVQAAVPAQACMVLVLAVFQGLRQARPMVDFLVGVLVPATAMVVPAVPAGLSVLRTLVPALEVAELELELGLALELAPVQVLRVVPQQQALMARVRLRGSRCPRRRRR